MKKNFMRTKKITSVVDGFCQTIRESCFMF